MWQKSQFIGRIGKDPDFKTTANEVKLAKTTIATSETHKDKAGEKITSTEWHSITFWNKLAEIAAKHIKKGDLIYVDGVIRNKKWTDSNGVERYGYEIEVKDFRFLSPKGNSENKPVSAGDGFVPAPAQQDSFIEDANVVGDEATEDLPF